MVEKPPLWVNKDAKIKREKKQLFIHKSLANEETSLLSRLNLNHQAIDEDERKLINDFISSSHSSLVLLNTFLMFSWLQACDSRTGRVEHVCARVQRYSEYSEYSEYSDVRRLIFMKSQPSARAQNIKRTTSFTIYNLHSQNRELHLVIHMQISLMCL